MRLLLAAGLLSLKTSQPKLIRTTQNYVSNCDKHAHVSDTRPYAVLDSSLRSNRKTGKRGKTQKQMSNKRTKRDITQEIKSCLPRGYIKSCYLIAMQYCTRHTRSCAHAHCMGSCRFIRASQQTPKFYHQRAQGSRTVRAGSAKCAISYT